MKTLFYFKSLVPVLFALLLVLSPLDVLCADKNTQAPPFQVRKDNEIKQIAPRKPVRIKLHRTANGEYTWDLTGDNADDVIRTDTRLRKMLKFE